MCQRSLTRSPETLTGRKAVFRNINTPLRAALRTKDCDHDTPFHRLPQSQVLPLPAKPGGKPAPTMRQTAEFSEIVLGNLDNRP